MKTRNQGAYLMEARKIIPDVAGVLTGAIVLSMTFFLINLLLLKADKIGVPDGIQILIMVFIGGTMITAIVVQARNESFNRSAALLANATTLIERAKVVLTDAGGGPTNDRVSWVTAARLLTRAEAVSSEISVPTHRAIYEAEHDYQRHVFWGFLRDQGKPLSASFFCGGPASASLGTAACDPNNRKGDQHWIPSRIASVIYRFFQFPESYEDPLDSSVELEERELDRLAILGQRGFTVYIRFRKKCFAVGNKVFQRNNGAHASVISASEIDLSFDDDYSDPDTSLSKASVSEDGNA